MTFIIAILSLFAALCNCTPLTVQITLDIDQATLNETVTTNFIPCPNTLDVRDFSGTVRHGTFLTKSESDNCLYNIQWPYRNVGEGTPTLKNALIKTNEVVNTANSFREKAALSIIQQLYGTGWDTSNSRDYIIMQKIDGIASFKTEAGKYYTNPPATKSMCKGFMEQYFYPIVADAVGATVRDYGIQHLDLHNGNYLWNTANTAAYLIDWGSWQSRDKSEAALARKEALDTVARVVPVSTVCGNLPDK